jgi:hypothetical protein
VRASRRSASSSTPTARAARPPGNVIWSARGAVGTTFDGGLSPH